MDMKVEKGFYERLRAAVFAVFHQTFHVCYSVLSECPNHILRLKKFYHSLELSMCDMVKQFWGIQFVDILHIPLHRRLETLAVFQWTATFLYFGLACFAICFFLLFTPLFFVPLAYLVWYIYDYRTPEQGGRRWEWVRNWRVWSYCCNYFPVSLHRTVPIDPSKNYLFVYHPHGIMSFGAFISFATNAADFTTLFPGLQSTMLTLKYQFTFPLQREYSMAFGACTCSKESIDWLLTKTGPGNALVLVVGGASEALEARPDSYNLTIKQRKGFVRLALQHGTSLVPVYGFGENDLFNQVNNPPGSRLRKFQAAMTRIFSFSPPIFHGRGMFNYTFGFMPFRRPVHVVVGSPMEVEQIKNPTDDDVNMVHEQYLEHLVNLFETHKAAYGTAPDRRLNFI